MSRLNVPQWVEIIGVIAIVISLGLVVFEIRQNTDALSAQAVQALNTELSEHLAQVAADPAYAELLIRADDDLKSLSKTDKYRLFSHSWAIFNLQESAYKFHQKGLLTEADYAGWGQATCSLVNDPGWIGVFWADNQTLFDPAFVRDTQTRCRRP